MFNKMKTIILLFLLLISTSAKAPDTGFSRPPQPEIFSFESFKELVIQTCQHPEIVISQAVLESANFTSNIWKENNNPFGIRMYSVTERKWMFRHFDTWQDAVYYYSEFQNRKYKGGDYFRFLKELPYATDPNYVAKVKKIVEQWD